MPSGNCQIDWAVDTAAAPSPLHNTGASAVTGGTPSLDGTVPAGTPIGIFSAAREDPIGGNEMQWNFNVPAGKQVKVRMYFANFAGNLKQTGRRVFNVSIDGTTVLPNFDISASIGFQVGGMREFTVTSDGQVNVLFSHLVNNPIVSAIEVIDPSIAPGGGGGGLEYLARRSFDGSATGTATTLPTPGTDWSHARGAFVTNGKLYGGWDNGLFYSRPFDGTTVGAPTQVDLHGLTTSNFPVANITGMFFTNGRIYYTLANDARMYMKYFTPEDDAVGTQTFTVSGATDGLNWSAVSGMTFAQGKIYFGRTNGNLYRMNFANGVPTPGTEALISGPATGDGKTWTSRGMFIYGQAVDGFAPTVPGKASGVSNSTSSIDLTWAASTDNVSTTLDYHVFRDGVDIATVPSASTTTVSYTDAGLDGGSQHTYRITAVDAATNASGQSPDSDPITVQTPDLTPPTVPGAPTATANGKTKVDLVWPATTDDRPGQITYRIYRDGSQVGSVTSGSNTTVSFTDTGLSPATSYTYTVDAVDVSNNPSAQSEASNTVTTAGVIFADGFDSGNFTNWTSNTRVTHRRDQGRHRDAERTRQPHVAERLPGQGPAGGVRVDLREHGREPHDAERHRAGPVPPAHRRERRDQQGVPEHQRSARGEVRRHEQHEELRRGPARGVEHRRAVHHGRDDRHGRPLPQRHEDRERVGPGHRHHAGGQDQPRRERQPDVHGQLRRRGGRRLPRLIEHRNDLPARGGAHGGAAAPP